MIQALAAERCTGGFCPTIGFEGDRVLIIGTIAGDVAEGLGSIGPDEQLVSVPRELFREAALKFLGLPERR